MVDVETDDGVFFCKFNGKGKSDVSETDDGYTWLLAFGCWLLAICGCFQNCFDRGLLVVGFWLLAVSFWLLAVGLFCY